MCPDRCITLIGDVVAGLYERIQGVEVRALLRGQTVDCHAGGRIGHPVQLLAQLERRLKPRRSDARGASKVLAIDVTVQDLLGPIERSRSENRMTEPTPMPFTVGT